MEGGCTEGSGGLEVEETGEGVCGSLVEGQGVGVEGRGVPGHPCEECRQSLHIFCMMCV